MPAVQSETCDSLPNRYGLSIINTQTELSAAVAVSGDNRMSDLSRTVNGLKLDLRYAGRNNFTGTQLYPFLTTTYLRTPVARALKAVQEELNRQQLGIKIWDAYRPYSVTMKMWDLIKDERYVADPSKGSGHNKGIAVDLTLVSMITGKELNMGTGFDNFSDTAHHDFKELSAEAATNRKLLLEVMVRHGFRPLDTEWWHYYWSDGTFGIMDLSFDDLKRLTD